MVYLYCEVITQQRKQYANRQFGTKIVTRPIAFMYALPLLEQRLHSLANECVEVNDRAEGHFVNARTMAMSNIVRYKPRPALIEDTCIEGILHGQSERN